MLEMASQSTSINSKGGMITKLEAAKIAMNGGCEMIIANGLKNFPLSNFSYEKKNLLGLFLKMILKHSESNGYFL